MPSYHRLLHNMVGVSEAITRVAFPIRCRPWLGWLGCSENEVCPQVRRVLWFGLFSLRGRAPAMDLLQRIGRGTLPSMFSLIAWPWTNDWNAAHLASS